MSFSRRLIPTMIAPGLICIFAASLQAQDLDSLVTHSLEFARDQLTNTVSEVNYPSQYPRSTGPDGKWTTRNATGWASGFFAGCLWYMYECTGDNSFRDWAEKWTAGLEVNKTNTETHDVGFIIFNSFGHAFRLTGRESFKEVILETAQSLASRYNDNIGCIRSWDNRTFPVIIDGMMNLEILFWASKNGGPSSLYDVAVSHALKTMEHHVRDDGTTYQIVDFDPSTGDVIRKETHQGAATESTWSRGQAWGMYGFTMCYRETGDERFLQTAQKLADFVITNAPDDYVPYWDYFAPNIPNEEKDVSATAIAASALLELSALVTESDAQSKYYAAALNMLSSLTATPYLAEGSNSSGILLHGVGNRNRDIEVDVSLIYADYYFIEALARYRGLVTSVASAEQDVALSEAIQLVQNYPNPFNTQTAIGYRLQTSGFVELGVYDVKGRLVQMLMEGHQQTGEHRLLFDGSNLASGTYFLRLKVGSQLKGSKMMLLR